MKPVGAYDFLQIDGVRWGADVAAAAATEAERRGASRVLLVASKSLATAAGLEERLRDSLGDVLVGTFVDTAAHVPRSSVLACLAAIERTGADLVLTVGGGTAIDTVKVALLLAAAGHTRFDDLAVVTDPDGTRHVPPVGDPPIRQIVVPTTLSGAEFSDLAGCVDPSTAVKQLFTAPRIGSAAVIFDPELTLHTPERLWLSTGVRALDHAVETLCSTAATPFTDANAIAAISLLARSLVATKADPTDLTARLDSQHAVWLSCAGLNRVPWGASHGIGHQLGAVAGVPHGYCSCVMLPHVVRHNQPATADGQDLIARAFGTAGSAADAIAELVATLGLPSRLRDVGVTREQLPTIAELSLPNMFVRQNPRPLLDAGSIHELLEAAW